MVDTEDSPKLTPKQRRFIAAYIGPARFNATRAAIDAGYSENSAREIGYQLRKTSHIRARIDELLDAETITATEILHELTDVGMRRLDEFVVVTRYDAEGNPIAAKMDASAKLKALELLGKNRAMFTENLNVDGDVGIRYEIVGVDPEEMV